VCSVLKLCNQEEASKYLIVWMRISFPRVVLVHGYVNYIVGYEATLLEIHNRPAIYLEVFEYISCVKLAVKQVVT